ncbi:phosphoadenylyl-sulfate reductase [Kaistia dalseonensis]|uniref:Adenosine 5'-phosphosulfate reductase n=1 Tax=Kaistia dalseonensis TaxID=410840 RepID=A0ABU0H9T2_9HYPH|nr:phosphoadenylyl-sulfate reductase [Kaistia dalseonensis]MCX5495917.1 phosphoadenylyl-sulfate reductase [Kaistia dalseonensis]MDQ0438520.1 phosphoadenosine phosphosulfate reductase [Kaistia dalseonensis]
MARLDPAASGFDQPAPVFDHESAGLQDVAVLNARAAGLSSREVVARALFELFPERIALVSSFGAESSVLLHLVASVDRSVPVVFIDTLRLFPETLAYRDTLVERLGLTNVRTVVPLAETLAAQDPYKGLWMSNADLCCHIRKTEPLERALEGFDAWFTGRKRFQAATRAEIQLFERDGARIKVNPLATWSSAELKAYMAEHDLPAHPLVAQGYPSIGCVPCTSKVKPGEDERAGRWRGLDKIECGIHLGEKDGSGI